MPVKNRSAKIIHYVIALIFFILAIVLIEIDPTTIKDPFDIDYEKKIFHGNLPFLLLIASIVFFWLGLKEKKDELADAKKALTEAANTLAGRIITLSFRFGPDDIQENLKKSLKLNTLTGNYTLSNKNDILQKGQINFYEHGLSKTVMAEFKDIPFQDDNLIAFEIKVGNNILKLFSIFN